MDLTLTQAILLGILQGLTEFLPISSSGHLVLVRWVFGWAEPGLSFDVALHIGTLLAVVIYFRHDWVRLVGAFLQSLRQRQAASFEARLAWLLVIGTIPGALAGALAESRVERFFHSGGSPSSPSELRGIVLITAALMLMGIVLYLADHFGRRSRPLEKLGLWDSLLIGLAQAVAIIPGVSRSGATISMGLVLGLDRASAARFSFLLSAPVIAGAGLKQIYDVLRAGLPSGEGIAAIVGLISAAVVGYLAIAFMLRFLQRNSTLVFAIYRLALGALLLILVFQRA